MGKFRVVSKQGMWDGQGLHKQGTVLEILPKDYPTLLHLGLEGADEESRQEMAKRFKGVHIPVEAELSNLDPSNPEDRRTMAELIPHARVVEEAPKPGV